jgi:hypothetical protein
MDPDFGGSPQIVVDRAQLFQFSGQPVVFEMEPLDFASAGAMLLQNAVHGGSGSGRRSGAVHEGLSNQVKCVHA